MMHKAWSSIEEVPYCFARSSIKFHGHTGGKKWRFESNLRLLGRSQLWNPSDLPCCNFDHSFKIAHKSWGLFHGTYISACYPFSHAFSRSFGDREHRNAIYGCLIFKYSQGPYFLAKYQDAIPVMVADMRHSDKVEPELLQEPMISKAVTFSKTVLFVLFFF